MYCVEITFDFMFDMFLKALLSSYICKQALGTYLSVGRSKLGILGENGKNPKVVVQNCDCTLKRAPKHAPSVQPLVATAPCTLKRTGAVSAPFDFRSGLPGINPSFVKNFFQLV